MLPLHVYHPSVTRARASVCNALINRITPAVNLGYRHAGCTHAVSHAHCTRPTALNARAANTGVTCTGPASTAAWESMGFESGRKCENCSLAEKRPNNVTQDARTPCSPTHPRKTLCLQVFHQRPVRARMPRHPPACIGRHDNGTTVSRHELGTRRCLALLAEGQPHGVQLVLKPTSRGRCDQSA